MKVGYFWEISIAFNSQATQIGLMKILRIASVIAALLACLQGSYGQGFMNLDFEQSTIVSSSPSGYGFDYGTADVPGWTEYNGWGDGNYPGGTTLIYNNQPQSEPGVALEGTDYFSPAIQGQYSLFLFAGGIPGETNGVAIGQTGQIPPSAKSMTFWWGLEPPKIIRYRSVLLDI